MTTPIIVNQSTTLVQVDTSVLLAPYIVLLSNLNSPGSLLTIRDSTGNASLTNNIVISTTVGVKYLDGGGINSNIYTINQPYGFLTVTPKTSNIWGVTNTFAFPDASASANLNLLNVSSMNVSTMGYIQRANISTALISTLCTVNVFIQKNLSVGESTIAHAGFYTCSIRSLQDIIGASDIYAGSTLSSMFANITSTLTVPYISTQNVFVYGGLQTASSISTSGPMFVGSSISTTGNLAIGGSTFIQGQLTVLQAAFFNSSISTKGALNVGYETILNSSLTVASISTLSNMTVCGSLSVMSTLYTRWNSYHESSILASGSFSTLEDVNIRRNLSTLGNVFIGKEVFTRSSMLITGAISTLHDINVRSNVSILGNLYVKGDIVFDDVQVNLQDIIASSIYTQYNISTMSSLIAGGFLHVNGSTLLRGTVCTLSNFNIRGLLSTASSIIVGDSLNVFNTGFFGSNISTPSSIGIGNSLNVGGPTNLQGFLSTFGQSAFYSSMQIQGSVSVMSSMAISCNLDVANSLTTRNMSLTGSTFISTLAVTNTFGFALNISSSTLHHGLFSTSGAMNIGGLISTTNALIVGSTINTQLLAVRSGMSVFSDAGFAQDIYARSSVIIGMSTIMRGALFTQSPAYLADALFTSNVVLGIPNLTGDSAVSFSNYGSAYIRGNVTVDRGILKLLNVLQIDAPPQGAGTTTNTILNDTEMNNLSVRGLTKTAKIGINCNAPAYDLDVSGTMNVSGKGTFSSNVGIFTTTPSAQLDIRGGGDCNDNYGSNLIAFQYSGEGGGLRHLIRSRHAGTNTTLNVNAIDFWLNTSNSTDGSATITKGIGNVNTLSVTAAGIGISCNAPRYALDVSGTTNLNGDLTSRGSTFYFGGNSNSNLIRFYGTTGESPSLYTATVIGEYLFGGANNESSELILFKANDGNTDYGRDRVRVLASGGFQVDINSAAFWTDGAAPPTPLIEGAFCVAPNGNVGIGKTSPEYSLDVSGSVNVTGGVLRTVFGQTTFTHASLGNILIGSNGGYGIIQTNGTANNLLIGGTTAGGTVQVWANNLRVDCNVGIGVNPGTYKLNVSGTANIEGNTTVGGSFTAGQFTIFPKTTNDYTIMKLRGGNTQGYFYGDYQLLDDGIHMGYNYYASNGVAYAPGPNGFNSGCSRISMRYGSIDFNVGFSANLSKMIGIGIAGVDVSGTMNVSGNIEIGSAGKLGIGKTPSANLDVSGTMNVSGNIEIGSAGKLGIGKTPTANLDVSGTMNVTGVTTLGTISAVGINTSGNIGINKASNASYQLDVSGTANFSGLICSGTGFAGGTPASPSSAKFPNGISGTVTLENSSNTGTFFVGGVTTLSNSVGINCTPGSVRLDIQNSGTSPLISLQDISGGFRHFITSQHSNLPASNSINFWLNNQNNSSTSAAPGSGNVQMMSIAISGIGINTSSISARLDIQGGRNTDGNAVNAIAFQSDTIIASAKGGFRHFITTRHNNTGNINNSNAIDFWLNRSSSATGSSTAGISNVNTLSVTAAGIGISCNAPQYALDVNGTTNLNGDLKSRGSTFYFGGNSNSNLIRFYGTYGESPDSYTATVIGEYLFGGARNESSELILFKGDDGNTDYGRDRVRVLASGGFQVDINSTNAFWTDGAAPPTPLIEGAFCVAPNGNVGIGKTSPGYSLDVNGTLNVTGLTTLANTSNIGTFTVGTTTVAQATRLNGTLDVLGATNLGGGAQVGSGLTVGGGLSVVSGNLSVGQGGKLGVGTDPDANLDVSGTMNVRGNITARGTISVDSDDGITVYVRNQNARIVGDIEGSLLIGNNFTTGRDPSGNLILYPNNSGYNGIGGTNYSYSMNMSPAYSAGGFNFYSYAYVNGTRSAINSSNKLLMNIVPSGSVGIGKENPTANLDVSGTMNVSGKGIFSSNVGIFTTTPWAQLDIRGGSDSTGNNGSNLIAFQYVTGGFRHFITSRHSLSTNSSGNAIDFWLNNSTASNGSSTAGTGNKNTLSVTAAGIGISCNAPQYALDVNGTTNLNGEVTFKSGVWHRDSYNNNRIFFESSATTSGGTFTRTYHVAEEHLFLGTQDQNADFSYYRSVSFYGGLLYCNRIRVYGHNNSSFQSVDITGSVYASGSISGASKNFMIDHPILSNTSLIHCSIEAPRCDLIYRNKKQLSNGYAEIDIEKECTANDSKLSPGTFDALCRNAQVFLNNNDTFDRVKGYVSSHMLFINSENSESSAMIDWMVIAERNDSFIREFDKTDSNGLLILEHPKASKPAEPPRRSGFS